MASASATIFAVLPEWAGFALLGVATTAFALTVVLAFLALYHAEFPPLRAKNIRLVVVSLLASLLLYAGLVHAVGLLSPSLPLQALQYCSFWRLWLLAILGIGGFNIALTTRLHSLVQVIRWNRHPTAFRRVLPALLCWLPLAALGLITFWSPNNSLHYDASVDMCVAKLWWKYTLLAILLVNWLVQLGIALAIVNIGRSVQEYKECLVGLVVAGVVLTAVAVTFLVNTNKSVVAQVLILGVVLIALHAHFYYSIGPVLWGTLFHRDHTLKEFILDLQTEGADYQQKMQAQSSDQLTVDSSYRQMLRKQSGVGAMGGGMSIGAPELNY